MRLFVKVKTNAKKEKIEIIDSNHLIVFVKDPPLNGKANKRMIKMISKHFKKSPSLIEIVSGESSSNKIINIL